MQEEEKLSQVLSYYLGAVSGFLLKKELGKLHISSVGGLSEDKKKELISCIMHDLIAPVTSRHQLVKIRERLCEVFGMHDQYF